MRGDERLSLPLHLFVLLTCITYAAPCMKYLLANRIFMLFPFAYSVFSLTLPASMQIYWKKRKRLRKKRVQLPED